ncbi:MAG: ABC transporter substrate-binding protein [Actinomycetes bacterium]|jgi:peptide/nickel transport system substrate-binding protein|nr:ABC transporter substrate-binding protein [Actinomycetes bacterium]
MKKSKVLLLMLVVALAMGACVGCGKKAAEDGAQTGAKSDTLTIALGGNVSTLDPAFCYDYTNNPPANQITEGLLFYDNNDQLQPLLLEKWEEVDSLTYVYTVRSNVNFSNGNPMTLDDVLYSIERYRNPDIASYLLWMYDNVDTIEQTGDWEFTVKLKQADALWKHTFATTAGHIMEKEFSEQAADNLGKPGTGTMGTGAYALDSWDVGSQLTLKYNENYWNRETAGVPDVKTIIFQNIEEDSTRVLAAASRQVDINVQTPVDMAGDIEKAEGVELLKLPSAGLTFLAFNNRKAPFDDVNARRAVASAIDVIELQKNVIKDYGEATNWMALPPTMFTFEKPSWEAFEPTIKKYEYNLDEAKKYLAASKYPDGFEVRLMVDSTSTFNSLALALQQSLAELNIKVELWKVPNVETVDYQFGKDIKDGVRPYDMGIYEWFSDFPDPSGDLVPIYMSTNAGEGGSNTSAYDNKEVDKLLLQQAASIDEVERTKLMQDAISIIADEMPMYIMDHPNYLVSKSDRVEELNFSPFWIWNFYVRDIKLAQ